MGRRGESPQYNQDQLVVVGDDDSNSSAQELIATQRRREHRTRRDKKKRRQDKSRSIGQATLYAAFVVAMLLGWIFIHFGLGMGTTELPAYKGPSTARDVQDESELHTCRVALDEANRKVSLYETDPLNQKPITNLDLTEDESTPAPPARQSQIDVSDPREPLTYKLDSIEKRARLSADKKTVILSFCSIKYLEPMLNWIGMLSNHGLMNYGIVCLDDKLRGWLKEHGTECQYILTGWKHGVWDPEETSTECSNANGNTENGPMPLAKCKVSCEYDVTCRAINYDNKRMCTKCQVGYATKTTKNIEMHVKRTVTTLWFARWRLLQRLLMNDIHVMLADLDAIFLKDPMPVLAEVKDADLIAQRGSFPQWLSARWGAALCMGFVFWRSTLATKAFTLEMHKVISQCGDDQIAVNEALDHLAVSWEGAPVGFTDSTTTAYGKLPTGFRVAMLPHSQFPRKCDDMPIDTFKSTVYVAHCYESLKNGAAKKRKAKKFGLWCIRDDWEDQPMTGDFNSFIRSLVVTF